MHNMYSNREYVTGLLPVRRPFAAAVLVLAVLILAAGCSREKAEKRPDS